MLILTALTCLYLAASICYIWPYAAELWTIFVTQRLSTFLIIFLIVSMIALTPVYNLYSFIAYDRPEICIYEDDDSA